MSYTASALSFMLDGLNKPVVFTGSQIPLCELRSDGRDNLINSMLIAADGVANEVCLYFAGKLLLGNRSTKVSADELMAFASPNYPALANVGIDIMYNRQALMMPKQAREFSLTEMKQVPIGVLKIFPCGLARPARIAPNSSSRLLPKNWTALFLRPSARAIFRATITRL